MSYLDDDDFVDALEVFDEEEEKEVQHVPNCASSCQQAGGTAAAAAEQRDSKTSGPEKACFPPVNLELLSLAKEPYPLHRAAFEGNAELLRALAHGRTPEELGQLDQHGNPALHLACIRGHARCAVALAEAGAPMMQLNARGWENFIEAVQAGHKQLAKNVLRKAMGQNHSEVRAKKAAVLAGLRALPDFTMQLKWELGSNVPGIGALVRNLAPHDTYTLWKKGNHIRVDGSLMGIQSAGMDDDDDDGLLATHASVASGGVGSAGGGGGPGASSGGGGSMLWKRGAFSLLYDMSGDKGRGVFANRRAKKWMDIKVMRQKMAHAANSQDLGAEVVDLQVEALASTDIIQRKKVRPAEFRFKPVAGWLSKEVHEKVDGWNCKLYEGSGRMVMVTRYKMPYVFAHDAKYDEYLEAQLEPDPVYEMPLNMITLASKEGASPEKNAIKTDIRARLKRARELRHEARASRLAAMPKPKQQSGSGTGVVTAEAGQAGGDAGVQAAGGSGAEGRGRANGSCDVISSGSSDACLSLGAPCAGVGAIAAPASGAAAAAPAAPSAPTSSGLRAANSSTHGSGDTGGGAGPAKAPAAVAAAAGGAGKEKDKEASAAAKKGRKVTGRCWMAKDFPLSLNQLLPVLEVVGSANKAIAKVAKFMRKYGDMEVFPVKVQIPLLLSVYASLSCKQFRMLGPKDKFGPDFFTVPADFTMSRPLVKDLSEEAGGREPKGPGRRRHNHPACASPACAGAATGRSSVSASDGGCSYSCGQGCGSSSLVGSEEDAGFLLNNEEALLKAAAAESDCDGEGAGLGAASDDGWSEDGDGDEGGARP